MTGIRPPDVDHKQRESLEYAPSWSASGGYINDEHRGIYEATKDLPGWQDPADSEKLYEIAYHNGSVILEIGVFGGRSAVVELRGALAARTRDAGLPAPQYFGVDVDPAFVQRSFQTLSGSDLAEHCLLYHGDLAQFLGDVPIVPTMVFVDGDHSYEGCHADLQLLAGYLSSGTPVLCHDYGGIPGVRRAVDEWIDAGAFEAIGQFAGSMLLKARGIPGRQPRRLSADAFAAVRSGLLERYFSTAPPRLCSDRTHTPVRDLTAAARIELAEESPLDDAPGDTAGAAQQPKAAASVCINPPVVVQDERPGFAFAPSWPGGEYLSEEHRGIYEATKDLPGWQDPADSEKLYEIAYHSGSVILEIGVFGGRSAVVELRGALAATARDRGLPVPQFFGVDVDPGFVDRSFKTISGAGVAEHCLLYHGDFGRFLRELPIVPTMVFVDGDHRYEGCWADLRLLSQHLAPGTPVLCHDYGGIPGVQRAVDEWIATGAYQPMGQFAGSMLLRARGVPGRLPRGLSPDVFARTRAALLDRYFRTEPPMLQHGRHHTPVRDLTTEARDELLGTGGRCTASRRARWPYAMPDAPALPPTMPGGLPWPRISVITPSYNQGRYIEETILSVRNQGYPNIEHIIMDGGSKDQTRDIVEKYRDGIAHFVSEKDEGQSDAINKGFALATGEILTWLNSDDMLAPGALAAAALAFQQSGADMVAGECHIFRDGQLVQKHLTSCPNGPLPLDDLLDIDNRWMAGQFFYQPEVMFTRDLWQRAGAHVRQDLYHSMDYELWLRFAHAGARLHVLGRPIAHFRAHDEQKTAGDVVGGFRAELPRARDAFLKRIGRVPESSSQSRAPAARRSLRIVFFNDLGYAYGAGIAHRRMVEAFLTGGHQVFTLAATLNDHHGATPRSTFEDIVARIASFEPDLVIVGNLHGAHIDPAVLGHIAERFATAFVMHDIWLLTGRCAYAGTCRKYISGCDESCTCAPGHPRLAPEKVHPAWETKRHVLSTPSGLHIWGNSNWAVQRVNEALAGAASPPPADAIKFGFDLEVLRPRDKATCRDVLGLPRDAFIIMSSASSLADPRKGLAHLAQALSILQLQDYLVTCVGWPDPASASIPSIRPLGYTTDPQRLAMIYAAADIFVGPSLEEAFGQVFIEAAACGTPSVGYPVDGKPEAILDGVSGVLARAVSPIALAEAIDELYTNPDYRENLRRWGRLWVENEWSMSSSYHRMVSVMRTQGLADRLGLVPKIDLAVNPPEAPPPVLLRPTYPAWRPVSNFDHWEGPYPQQNLPRCRWALGPVATFQMDMDRPGRQRLLVSYRCFEPGQRVRLVHDGKAVSEVPVPVSDAADGVLSFDVDLRPGTNTLDLHFWRWQTRGRPLALLITGITAIGQGGEKQLLHPAVNGRSPVAIECKQGATPVRS